MTNTVPSIQHFYGTKYGDKDHGCEGCPSQSSGAMKEVVAREDGRCSACPAKEQEDGAGAKEEDRCSDCPGRKCDHCLAKEDGKKNKKENEEEKKDAVKDNVKMNASEKRAPRWAFWRS